MSTALIDRIAKVDPTHAETMRSRPTTFETVALPFYKKFKLVKATVMLPNRPMLLEYADDGAQLVQLTGAAGDIAKVNGLEGLRLDQGQMAAYLKFFVAHSTQGKSKLVEREDEVQWLPASATDPALKAARAKAAALIKPVELAPSDTGYKATAVVLTGKELSKSTYAVDSRGNAKSLGSDPAASDLPVPYTL